VLQPTSKGEPAVWVLYKGLILSLLNRVNLWSTTFSFLREGNIYNNEIN